MKLTFLGTGTSCGVPVIGCQCEVCQSADPHDQRTRCSVLVETDETRLLIDCGPDFRQQILPMPFRKIDGILITHSHYDHVGGWMIFVLIVSLVRLTSMLILLPERECWRCCHIVLQKIAILGCLPSDFMRFTSTNPSVLAILISCRLRSCMANCLYWAIV